MSDLTVSLNATLEERGWSISEFARRAGISQSAASDVLNEKIPATCRFCMLAADALDEPREKWLRIGGYLPPQPLQVEDEQEIITAWRRLQPDERAVIKRAICGLVESAPAKVPQRGDPPQKDRERMEAPDEPLGDRTYDLDEIAMILYDTVATVLTPEHFKIAVELLRQRERARMHGDPAQNLDDQLARTVGGNLQPKTERVPSRETDLLSLD